MVSCMFIAGPAVGIPVAMKEFCGCARGAGAADATQQLLWLLCSVTVRSSPQPQLAPSTLVCSETALLEVSCSAWACCMAIQILALSPRCLKSGDTRRASKPLCGFASVRFSVNSEVFSQHWQQ
eukprot:443095-Rhodomonas_salina.1